MAMTGGTAYLVKSEKTNYGSNSWTTDLYIYVKVISQNVIANTSTIALGMYVYSKYSIAWSDFGTNGTSYIGTATSGSNCFTFTNGQSGSGTKWLIEDKQVTVYHNSNGTLTLPIYWHWGVNSPWGQYTGPSGSYNVTLSTNFYRSRFENDDTVVFVGIYAEEGLSGTQAESRPQFMKMIEDCRSGHIDCIWTKSVSRFGRNTVDTLIYTRELRSLGIDVFFEKENIHSTESSGELMLTLMAAFAESESETMSANIKWGKRRRYEQGITGSITLNGMYGFRQNKGVVTVVEDEAELVRRIYKDFIDGYSYGEIADRLIADEVPTRMPGASWAKTTVQHIIRNEKYCGDCLFQKAFIANPITHQQVRNNGELPKYLVEDCLPAIVDKETWKLAQAVAARHTPHRQAPNERYPFTGKLFCGICSKPYYYYHYTTTNKQLLAAYRCMSRKTQSAVEVPGQTYTPPHKATFNLNASPELIAYRERYCKPPKERPMLCTDVRISIDLPQKAFCRAWNLIVAKKLRYQATLRSTVDNAEDILVRYRAEEMCLLIDEIGKINEFSYPLMLKTLDRVVVNANGKLTFIFQSGIKITV